MPAHLKGGGGASRFPSDNSALVRWPPLKGGGGEDRPKRRYAGMWVFAPTGLCRRPLFELSEYAQ